MTLMKFPGQAASSPHGYEVGGPDDCWEWTGPPLPKNGYGRTRLHGVLVFVHRRAWELVNGPIPPGMMILHSCDNPPCCNPKHLSPGTALQNSADMRARDRHCRGERKTLAKLTDDQVREMRTRHSSGVSQRSLAREYAVSPMLVNGVVRRVRWSHVT